MAVTIQEGTPITSGGVLLSVEAAKLYLRITDSVEDDLIGTLIEQAEAFAQGYIGRTFASTEQTHRISVGVNSTGFMIPNAPLDSSEAPTVTYYGPNEDTGTDVTTSFTVTYGTGRCYAGGIIPQGEYVVVATGGMENRSDWSTVASVRLTGAIRDLVAEWYANRDPGASSVTDGDMSRVTASPVTGATFGIPPRVLAVLDSYRGL